MDALALCLALSTNGVDVPTGPKGQRPPADDGKDPAAKALGAKGGAARAAKMTPERRAEIAKKAAAKRWGPKE